MKTMLAKQIQTIRNPFRLVKLPLMGWLCKSWFDNTSNKNNRLKAKCARALFLYLRRLNLKQTGIIEFNKKHLLTFNTSNTQFHAFFLNKYKDIYESDVAVLLELLTPNNGCFYDVGANFGYFSLYLGSRANFKGKIFSFEIAQKSFNDLQNMVKQSNLTNIINTYNVGAFSKKDLIYLSNKKDISGNYSIEDKVVDDKKGFPVLLERLDSLEILEPDVMKIDVEGFETEVLEGCTGFLNHKKPHIIFESTIQHDKKEKVLEPLKFLKKYNYNFYNIQWVRDNGQRKEVFNTEGYHFQNNDFIVLSELQFQDRFQLNERINILAVNADRINELTNVFNMTINI